MVAVRSKPLIKDAWMSQGIIPDYDGIAAQAQREAVICIHCGKPVHPSNLKKHTELYHQSTSEPRENGVTRDFRGWWMLCSTQRVVWSESGIRVITDQQSMTRPKPKHDYATQCLVKFLNRGKSPRKVSA